MINIKYIVLEEYEKLENLQVNDEAIPLHGFIAVKTNEFPGRTIYINRDKIIAIGINDDQQDKMKDFITPVRMVLGRM